MSIIAKATANQKENIQNPFGCDFNTNSSYPILHNHTFFEFTYFFARTKHYINGRTMWLEKDSLIFIRPHDTHYLSNCQETLGHLNLKLSCEHMRTICDYIDKDFYNKLLNADDSLLHIQNSPEFGRFVMKTLDEILTAQDKNLKYTTCKFLICDFLKLIYQHLFGSTKQNINPTAKNILSLLQNTDNFSENVTDLLSGLGYSYMHAYRLFKDATGQTPNTFFTEQKLHYAANLLTYTRYKIVEISGLCGFASQSRFDTAFKKYYGLSPSQYRNKQGSV